MREEIDKIHGARSPERAIAIGLSEARRAGVDLPPPKKGKVKESTRKNAEYAYEVEQHEREPKNFIEDKFDKLRLFIRECRKSHNSDPPTNR